MNRKVVEKKKEKEYHRIFPSFVENKSSCLRNGVEKLSVNYNKLVYSMVIL